MYIVSVIVFCLFLPVNIVYVNLMLSLPFFNQAVVDSLSNVIKRPSNTMLAFFFNIQTETYLQGLVLAPVFSIRFYHILTQVSLIHEVPTQMLPLT